VKRFSYAAGIVLTLILMLGSSLASAEIIIGINSKRGVEQALKEWGPLGDYLTRELNDKVVIKPLTFMEVRDFAEQQRDGFLMCNPVQFVKAKKRAGAVPLVTLKNKDSGDRFGGVIIARADSGIRAVGDMKGKRVMAVKFSSAGGWMFQKAEMLRHGLSPEKECILLEGGTQDKVVHAVRDGKADVGTVRTNQLERMSREGKIDLSDFTIINKVDHVDFPELCSTPLYPAWTVAALKNADTKKAARLKAALLAIPEGHPVLKPCKLAMFVPALDYGPVEEVMSYVRRTSIRQAREARAK
jgi:ABC-type phosphate/phosphonate transport system substrate-binding protein